MKYIATYWQNRDVKSKTFKTTKGASQFLLDGEYRGELSWANIKDSNGKLLAQNKILSAYEELFALGAKERGW